MTLFSLFVIVCVVGGGYMYARFLNKQVLPAAERDIFESIQQPIESTLPFAVSPNIPPTSEIQAIIRLVSAQIILQPGDTLQDIRIVKDVATLQSQNPTFFQDVAVDDYIFMFQKQIVLFRPSTQKVIKMEVYLAQ